MIKRETLIIAFSILLLCCVTQCKKDASTIQDNNWKTIYQNSDLYLYSINFLDKDNGFVMADSSGVHGLSDWKFVLSTTDGGNTWNHVTCTTNDNVNQFPLYDIGYVYAISKNVLLTTGYQVHRSNDTGKTWINVSSQLFGASINNLYLIDSLTWLVAAGNQILRTNNGGKTWETVFQTDFTGAFERFSFPSPDTGFINIGFFDMDHNVDVGLILKTTDRGQTWAILNPEPWKSNGLPIPYMVAMQFINENTGYILTLWDNNLFKTINGGDNWTLVSNTNIVSGLEYFITENFGYCSDGNTIYITNDGGKTWKVDYYYGAANSDILTWTFLKTGEGYALTRDHKIIKKMK
jgi:photosystem II stability/assembly factor-like uncharacterized protein